MLQRQRTGSVICSSCGVLVGVNDKSCYNCGRANPGLWGFAPLLRALGRDLGFVPFVIGSCGIVYVLGLVASRGALGPLLGPNTQVLFLFGASGAVPVFVAGRWWTVLSASWLHANVLHILFNMMAVRQLAPGVAGLYGPGRTVIIYTLGGVAGFALSSFAGAYLPAIPFLRGSQITVGASASISALIGALMYYGRRSGSRLVTSEATRYVLMLALYGFFMQGIDNYAHAGGFVGGYLVSMVLDPLTPERGDHVLIGLVCLGLSIASVAVSVIHGLQFF